MQHSKGNRKPGCLLRLLRQGCDGVASNDNSYYCSSCISWREKLVESQKGQRDASRLLISVSKYVSMLKIPNKLASGPPTTKAVRTNKTMTWTVAEPNPDPSIGSTNNSQVRRTTDEGAARCTEVENAGTVFKSQALAARESKTRTYNNLLMCLDSTMHPKYKQIGKERLEPVVLNYTLRAPP